MVFWGIKREHTVLGVMCEWGNTEQSTDLKNVCDSCQYAPASTSVVRRWLGVFKDNFFLSCLFLIKEESLTSNW